MVDGGLVSVFTIFSLPSTHLPTGWACDPQFLKRRWGSGQGHGLGGRWGRPHVAVSSTSGRSAKWSRSQQPPTWSPIFALCQVWSPLSSLGAVRCHGTQYPWDHHRHLPRILGEFSPLSLFPSYMVGHLGVCSLEMGA